jgi:UDP-N-acetylmuramoyl-tripeptide--D-alanyl-D-alanine ligase
MNPIFIIFILLWLFVLEKKLFFYLWFWQIKQYYIKRVLSDIREKGLFLIFPKFNFVKTFLILILFVLPFLAFYFLFFVYAFETFLTFGHIKRKRYRAPVFTKKSALLILFPHLILFGFLLFNLRYFGTRIFFLNLLLFDILAFFLFSICVILFLLPEWLLRKRNIILAEKKIKKLENLTVIGITGSYGKTSTKEILGFLLSKKFKVLKTPRHLNTDPAIAKFILKNLDENSEIFIVEMAAYTKGEIIPTCKMTRPKIGIICGVNEQHLSLFRTMENLISAEGGLELIQSLPKDGLVIFNGNNKYCVETYKKTAFLRKKITFAKFKDQIPEIAFDLLAENISVKKDALEFEVVSKDGKKVFVSVNLVGQHNIENILLAVSCAMELGMNLEEVANILKEIPQDLGVMQLKRTKNGLNIIDSTYSANPNGVISALDYLKIWEGKKAIVMPCLIELGEKSKEVHRIIGRKIAEVCNLAIITTEDFFEDLKKGAIDSGMKEENILLIKDSEKIFEKIKIFNEENDIVLLEGRIRIPQKLIELLIHPEF